MNTELIRGFRQSLSDYRDTEAEVRGWQYEIFLERSTRQDEDGRKLTLIERSTSAKRVLQKINHPEKRHPTIMDFLEGQKEWSNCKRD